MLRSQTMNPDTSSHASYGTDLSSNTNSQHYAAYQIPVEIWRPIIQLACASDPDGVVGCTLSRVCKYFREVSAPFRYRSIAVKGLASLLLFAELVECSPDIRITHLFLTNDHRYTYPASSGTLVETVVLRPNFEPKPRRVRDKIMAMLLPTKYGDNHVGTSDVAGKRRDIVQEALKGRRPEKATNAILMKAICGILNSQSQSLATLFLAYDFTGHTAIEDVPFALLPQLQELTVAARPEIPSDNLGLQVRSIIPPFSKMPALRKLDMVAVISRVWPHAIISGVLASIPGLTHICLPVMRAHNIGSMDHSLQECMFRIHELHPPEGYPAPSPLHLYVQMDPWEGQNMTGTVMGSTPQGLHIHQRAAAIHDCPQEQEENWKDGTCGESRHWELLD